MDYLYIVVKLMCVYAILATSLNLIKGYGGLFTVAHAAFFGIGAYSYALVTLNLGWWFLPALGLAFLVAAIASLVISIPSLRTSGEYLLLTTFAVQILASSLFVNLEITGGPAGLRDIPAVALAPEVFGMRGGILLVSLVVAVLCWLVMAQMARSPFGRVLKAIREDELVTLSLGKNVVALKVAAFAIGCGFAGLAGGVYAAVVSFINPDSFAIYMSFTIIVMVLLGGLAHPWGGVVGAVVLTCIEEVLRISLPSSIGAHVAQVLFGTILVAVVLWREQGLFPEHGASRLDQDDKALKNRGGAAHRPLEQVRARSAALGGKLLEVFGITKSYGGIQAVRGVNVSINRGEIVGIIGPNGAGKTTLFDMMAGATSPDAGEVRFAGQRVDRLPSWRLAVLGVGRLFQDARPFANMTVLDNVLVAFPKARREQPWLSWIPFDKASEQQRIEHAYAFLEFIGLTAHAQERAGSLSFGQQKLLGFTRLLAQGATLWLLDEPAAGIDPAMREEIRTVIRRSRDELGITVLIVEHNMDFLKDLADRVIFMAEGRVLREGQLTDIVRDPELNRLYLGA